MIEIEVTAEFENRFKKLPENIRKKAIKQQELFSIDPFYPSLHTDNWFTRLDLFFNLINTLFANHCTTLIISPKLGLRLYKKLLIYLDKLRIFYFISLRILEN